MVDIDEIIEETIKQMELGVVRTKRNKFYLKVHTKHNTHFEITPTLKIKNKEEFYSNIKKYISLFRNTGLIMFQKIL